MYFKIPFAPNVNLKIQNVLHRAKCELESSQTFSSEANVSLDLIFFLMTTFSSRPRIVASKNWCCHNKDYSNLTEHEAAKTCLIQAPGERALMYRGSNLSIFFVNACS